MLIYKLLPLRHLISLLVLVIVQSLVLVVEINGIFYAVPELIRIFTNSEEQLDTLAYIPPLMILLLSAFMRFISNMYIIFYTENERRLLTTFYLSAKMKSSLSDFNKEEAHEHTKKTISEADQVVNLYLRNIAELLTGLITVAICTYTFFSTGGIDLLAILTAIICGIIILNILLQPILRRYSKRLISANSERFKIVLNSYANFKFLRSNMLAEQQLDMLGACTKVFRNANIVSQVLSQAFINLIEILFLLISCALLFIYGDNLIKFIYKMQEMEGFLQSGIGVLILVVRLKPALNKIHSGYNRMNFGSEVNKNFIASLQSLAINDSGTLADIGPIRTLQCCYEPTVKGTLQSKVMLSAKVGEICIIHGDSGVGKTTLFDMMVGLYGKQKNLGMRINDIEIETLLDLNSNNYYYCTQSSYVINGNLRENILLGGTCSNKRLSSIIELLQLEDLQEREILEPAVLSGGEKSRINVARALISDKDILLFDESFSSFSNVITEDVMNYITENLQCICLIITHDVELIKKSALSKWFIK